MAIRHGYSFILVVLYILFLSYKTDAISFDNKPDPAYLHENVDDDTTVWTVGATCTVYTSCAATGSATYWYWGGWRGWAYTSGTRYYTYYYGCYKNVACNSCSTSYNDMFYASGLSIHKRACTSRGCGPTCTASYCMNAGSSYDVDVNCWHSDYPNGNGYGTTSFRLTAYGTGAPSISLQYGSSVTITNSYTTNNVVNRIDGAYASGNTGYNFFTYSVKDTSKFIAYDPYSTRSDTLFHLDGNYLRVSKSLSTEYTHTYSGIQLCLRDRRSTSDVCTGLTIQLNGCFEIPTCYNQGPQTFTDQHGVGSTLFTMTYPNPTIYGGSWQGLQWTLDASDLNVAAVDYNAGILKTNGAIIVWPYYPSRDYYARIKVGNSASCGRTSTCTVTFTVTFTNFAIRFSNLPATTSQHENYDAEFRVIQIQTLDDNGDHDNVTCQMLSFSPSESNMFEIRHNGQYKSDSWSIYRLACQQPQCEDICSQNIGCFSYDRYSQFVISIKCSDFYGTHVTSTVTLNLVENTPPSFTAANSNYIYIHRLTHSKDSYVTSFDVSNSDSGYDNDYIRYWIKDETKLNPWDYSPRSDTVFYIDTSTGFVYVKESLLMEYSYVFSDIQVCIRDRRDTNICYTFSIELTACYLIPTCVDQQELEDAFWETHPTEGTLFDMQYDSPGYHFTHFRSDWLDLTWTLDSSTLDVAQVVQNGVNGGILRTSGNITVWPSYPYREYTATIRVSNSESCGRTSTCLMTFRVYFTNWPIRFISLPDEDTVHENYDDEFLVHQIITYDYNNPAHDNVTCEMSVSPDESNMFQLRHDGNYKHDSWTIWRLACQYPKCESQCPTNSGCFNHDIYPDYVFTVTCRDAYGSSTTDYFTLHITDNSPPYLTAENVEWVSIAKETHGQDSFVIRVYASDDDDYIDDDYIRYNITDETKLIAWDYPNVTRTDKLFYINGLTGNIYVAADLSMEYSYVFRGIEICIADRRDSWICRDLTINMTACYEIPTCYDQEYLEFWDTHPVEDTLFNMMFPSPTYQFPVDFRTDWLDLTWSLDSSDLDVAQVVQDEGNGINEGILRTSANITVWPSWRYRDYTATIRVSNSESCGRTTTCVMSFRIWFTNWPIRFISLPDFMYVHENVDEEFLVHQIVTYDYNSPEQDNVTCVMSFTPYEDNFFELRHDGRYKHDSWSIWRLACQHPKCEYQCPLNTGCFTHDTTENNQFIFTVRCDDAYDSDVTDTFTLFLEDNSPPYFTDANEPKVYISKETHGKDDFVTKIFAADDDLYVDDDYIRWNITDESLLIAWDYPNVTRTDKLFYIDPLTGDMYVAADLSMEYSFVFRDIEICIADRRDSWICRLLTINMSACYEIPTCYDQEFLDFWDTHPVWDTLFNMKYPSPTYHFPVDFRSDWLDLTWSLDYSELDVSEVVQDEMNGVNEGLMRTNANITVWPYWRYRDYNATIRVNNVESCGRETTCELFFRIWFKNWPIRFISLPDESTVNEDFNDAFIVHEIITYDYNYHLHDNVTCEMTVTPEESTESFTLEHDGNFDYNSWSIHRVECPQPTCGFHCDKGIGCFTYNTTLNQQFVFTVHCWDAYDSDVTSTYTLHLDYNRAPTFTNLPNTITLNSDTVSDKDILYSIQYSDNENENMHYNFTYYPDNGIWNDILIFECDEFGNYYDNLANISATTYYHNMPESTYYIYICGTERRNMICETLTIEIKDHCPGNPTCTGDSRTIQDTTNAGTSLFTISAQQGAGSSGTLSFSFVSPTPAYFHVDQASGEITLAKTLVAKYPSKTYQLTAFVYDTDACNYGSCQFTITSQFTNHPISIENSPYTYQDLSEDIETSETLVVIETKDDNTDETVTCSLNSITSSYTTDPIEQNLFRVTQTYPGSNVWFIENRELPGFTAAILEYDITFECHDKYGSSDTGTLTVTIKPNETPTFVNLDATTSIVVDPSVQGKNSIIYTVSTSDEENDELTFSSSVSSSFVPLALASEGKVYLRRDVSITDEDGVSYFIDICIDDPLHTLQPDVCGKLTVTFISSQKYPVISNLPYNVSLPETTSGVVEIYDVDVEDENVDSVHTFSMTVYPSEAANMFSLHTRTGVLSLQGSASFDYEERNYYRFKFAVRDQYLVGLEKKDLMLYITDVNESPTIDITQDTVSFDEDTAVGTTLADKVATCSDVDQSDNHTFSIENSPYFTMDEDTSKICLAQEWNLEILSNTTVDLTIVCTDSGGLTDRKSLHITVSPVNEFDPVISPTSIECNINSNTTVVDTLGEITSVTDSDYGNAGNFYYSVLGVGDGSKYFTMTQTGLLRLKEQMTLARDKDFQFTIGVSDEDKTPRSRTAYCTVIAHYTAPPEEVPEEPSYCLTCTTEGKLAVFALAVEGLIMCAFLAHCFHHVYSVKQAQTLSFSNMAQGPKPSNGNLPTNTTVNSNNTRPDPQQSQVNSQQQNQQNQQDNRQDNNDDDEEDTSLSEDSDIDERLQSRSNQPFQPRNQPLPGGIDAAAVPGQFPSFGAFNYA